MEGTLRQVGIQRTGSFGYEIYIQVVVGNDIRLATLRMSEDDLDSLNGTSDVQRAEHLSRALVDWMCGPLNTLRDGGVLKVVVDDFGIQIFDITQVESS